MPRRALFTLPLLALLALGSGLTGPACKRSTSAPVDPPIVLGASATLSGTQKDLGDRTLKALRVAEQQLNAAGGVLGRRVVVDVRDDGSDAVRMPALVDGLFNENMVGFIGPTTTKQLESVQATFAARHTVLITPFSTSPCFAKLQPAKDRYIFRTACTADQQMRAIARYAARASFAPPTAGSSDAGTGTFKSCHKMMVVHYGDNGGNGLPAAQILEAEFAAGGGTFVDVTIQGGLASYATEVDQLKQAAILATGAVDCAVLSMRPADGAIFLREFKNSTSGTPALANFPFYGSIPFFQQDFIVNGRENPSDPTSPSAAEGVIGTACGPSFETTAHNAAFENMYYTQFPNFLDAGNPPFFAIPMAYDAVVLLALAIEKARSTSDGVAIRDALVQVSHDGKIFGPGEISEAMDELRRGGDINYQCASGPCDFDDFGNTAPSIVLWKVQGGAFVTLPNLNPRDLEISPAIIPPDALTCDIPP